MKTLKLVPEAILCVRDACVGDRLVGTTLGGLPRQSRRMMPYRHVLIVEHPKCGMELTPERRFGGEISWLLRSCSVLQCIGYNLTGGGNVWVGNPTFVHPTFIVRVFTNALFHE